MRKLVTNEYRTDLACVNFTVIPAAIETHDVVFVAMAQKETILCEIISHILEIIDPYIRVEYVWHSNIFWMVIFVKLKLIKIWLQKNFI